MAEGGGAQRQYWGPYLWIRYDLNPKNVRKAGPAVIPIGAEDEVLAFLIEDENP